LQLPEGYTVQFGGENKEMMEAFADLSLVLVFAHCTSLHGYGGSI